MSHEVRARGSQGHDSGTDSRSRWRSSSCRLRVDAQVTSDRIAARGRRAAELADLFGRLRQPALQPADADHAGQRRRTSSSSGCCQDQVFGAWQSTPLVVDGIMYVTQRPNDVMAVDAKTGRVFWQYRYTPCAGRARLLRRQQPRRRDPRRHALHGHARRASRRDRREERPPAVERRRRAIVKLGYSITMAPLIVKDKVIVGVGGGEYGIRGFIAAYDAKTGKEVWRFYTIPGPGEPGHETWSGDAWKTGGGSVWVTGSYDPATQPDLLGHRQSRSRLESRRSGPATTSTPTPSSRSTPTPAS